MNASHRFREESLVTIIDLDNISLYSFEARKMDNKQAKKLLDWYYANRRILPWREDPTPYHVWLSEIMLQQTRVEAVKPYYARFLERCPTIQDLANIPEETCLKLWEGLGYYSRARNLQKAAKIIVSDHGGELPKTQEQLSSLPGIGEYTQKAILAIAFQQPFVAVDGNLLRVFARLEAKRFSAITPALKKEADAYFASSFPLERPGDFNQALMDLGELVCLPNGDPLCERCPFASFCKAKKENDPSSYPGKKTKNQKKSEDIDVFLLYQNGKYAIHRRDDSGLLAGLFEFPNMEKRTAPEERERFLNDKGLTIVEESPLDEARHIFTHLIWKMKGYRIEVSGNCDEYSFLTPEQIKNDCSIPSAFRHYLDQLK